MKKSYFLMAAAATMFAACTQADFVNEIPETEQAIGFESFVGKSTRAEITVVEDLEKEGGKLYVWGYKTDATSAVTQIFGNTDATGTEVYFDDNAATKWNYADKKYWDKESTYDFYAVAPAAPTGVTYKLNSSKKILIEGATSASATTATDYLIDRAGNIGHQGKDGGIVKFDFNHVMTKVTVKVLCSEALDGKNAVLTDLTMSNWNANAGNFTQELTAAPDNAKYNDEWEIETPGTAGSAAYLTGGEVALNKTTPQVLGSWIIVPQDVAALKFTVSFKVGTETFLAHVGTMTEKQEWGADAHYTYTITVGPDAIEFDVNSVNNWVISDGSLSIE